MGPNDDVILPFVGRNIPEENRRVGWDDDVVKLKLKLKPKHRKQAETPKLFFRWVTCFFSSFRISADLLVAFGLYTLPWKFNPWV